MLKEGFEEVYHLKGGVLNYLEKVPEEQSLWRGECFVFDNRVTVRHDLTKGEFEQCHACRMPISAEDMQSSAYEPGISCPTASIHCRRRRVPLPVSASVKSIYETARRAAPLGRDTRLMKKPDKSLCARLMDTVLLIPGVHHVLQLRRSIFYCFSSPTP